MEERKDPRVAPIARKKKEIQALVAVLADPSASDREEAREKLARMGPIAVQPLMTLLESGNPESVRADAATSLGEIGDAGGAGPLRAALEDASEAVRFQAALALARIGDEPGLGILREAWKAGGDAGERNGPALAAAMQGDEEAVAFLVEAFRQGEATSRLRAGSALLELDTPKTIRPLLAALSDTDPDIQSLAAAATHASSALEAIEDVDEALFDAVDDEEGDGEKEAMDGESRHKQHYGFAHMMLPQLVLSDPAQARDMLLHEGGEAFLRVLWDKVAEIEELGEGAPARGLGLSRARFADGSRVALVTLPKPRASAEAQFTAAVFANPGDEEPTARYFTLELGVNLFGESGTTVLCEWTSDDEGNFSHVNFGSGPHADAESFLEAVAERMGTEMAEFPPPAIEVTERSLEPLRDPDSVVTAPRSWTITVLAGLGAGCCALAGALLLDSPLFGGAMENERMAALWTRVATGVGVALPLASVLLPWMWGFTPGARMGSVWFLFLGIAALAGAATPEKALIWVSAAGLVFGLAVVYRERALVLQIGPEGLSRILPGSWRRETTISWEEMDRIRVELVTMSIEHVVSVEAEFQGRITTTGGGKRIAFNSLCLQDAEFFFDRLLERAGPHIVRNTVRRIEQAGRVTLGPLVLEQDGIWWGRPENKIPYDEVEVAAVEEGQLVLGRRRSAARFSGGTPNAFWIGGIIEEMARRGSVASEEVSEQDRALARAMEAENDGRLGESAGLFEDILRKDAGHEQAREGFERVKRKKRRRSLAGAGVFGVCLMFLLVCSGVIPVGDLFPESGSGAAPRRTPAGGGRGETRQGRNARSQALQKTGPGTYLWKASPDDPSSTTILVDNGTGKTISLRLAEDVSFDVGPGRHALLDTASGRFRFTLRIPGATPEDRVFDHLLEAGRFYVLDPMALHEYTIAFTTFKTGEPSLFDLMNQEELPANHDFDGRVFFDAGSRPDFIFEPFPETLPESTRGKAYRCEFRSRLGRREDPRYDPPAVHYRRGGGGEVARLLQFSDFEFSCFFPGSALTGQMRNTFVGNPYQAPVEIRVNGFSISSLPAGATLIFACQPAVLDFTVFSEEGKDLAHFEVQAEAEDDAYITPGLRSFDTEPVPPAEAFDAWIARFLARDPDRRWEAVDHLVEAGEKAVDALLAASENDHAYIRGWSLVSLGIIGAEKAFESLLEGLQDPHDLVRQGAVRGLGELGDRRAISPLKRLVEESDSGFLRLLAAAMLFQFFGEEAGRPALVQALKEGDREEAEFALDALASVADEPSIELLIDVLDPGDLLQDRRFLGDLAYRALVSIGAPAVEPLMRRFRSTNIDRRKIVDLLAEIGDARAASVYIEALWDPDCRTQALSAMGMHPCPEAVPVLIKLLNPEFYTSKKLAFMLEPRIIKALKKATGEDFGNDCEAWKAWHAKKEENEEKEEE